jgi:hypothetical protein
MENLGYKQPFLIDCDPAKRPPNVDEKIYGELNGPATPITWSDARAIMTSAVPLAGELGEIKTKWLCMMKFAVENDGKLAPGIKAVSEWRREAGRDPKT